jgi:hypothetical protein
MKTNRLLCASGALLSTLLLIALAPAAHAVSTPDFDYTVTLNVSSLSSNANVGNGPFSLDLQLTQGSGNVSNTVKIYNFSTTGTGSGFGAADYNMGTESGTIGTGGIVTLTNSSSDNELAATFNPGTQTISFNVDETPNDEVVGTGTPIPDQFNIAVFDTNENNIATTDPSSNNELIESVLGEDPNLTTFSTTGSESVTVVVATPEPNSAALSIVAAGGLLGLVLLRRRYVV